MVKKQLLKWVGNKQRFAQEIVSYFPKKFGMYYEPFLGSGAVLGTLVPEKALCSDILSPLMEIWTTLSFRPEQVISWYSQRYEQARERGKEDAYKQIRESYNTYPNGADLLFLSRSCYGGVVRFRKHDGYMSTPCGIHQPISPDTFALRVREWYQAVHSTTFATLDYREALENAKAGDIVYCDPPYEYSQSILYGAQSFFFQELLNTIVSCKNRGVFVALSVNAIKHSGICEYVFPEGLFEKEIFISCGKSMLKRFQMSGKTVDRFTVFDKLLLTSAEGL